MASTQKDSTLKSFLKWASLKLDPNRKELDLLSSREKRDDDLLRNQNRDNSDLDDVRDSTTQKMFRKFKQMRTNPAKINNIKKLYAEMEGMYFNVSLISRAVDLVVDEVDQSEVSGEGILVECLNDKMKKDIEDMIEKVNLNSYNKPVAKDLVLNGNSYVVISLDKEGVSGLMVIDPRDCDERIEFTASEMEKELRGNAHYVSMLSRNTQIKQIVDIIVSEEDDDFDEYFKPHLIGFQFGERALPPWRVLHFRNEVSSTAFSPYGQPYFLRSLFAAKQLQMAMGLQLIARQARMPIQIWKLKLPPGTNPTTQLDKGLEFVNEIQNSGMNSTRKEEEGIGAKIYTIADLFEFEMVTPEIDIGKVDDLEILMNDLVISTGIPRNFIDPNGGSGFGNSGISLREQFKPFGRSVLSIQSEILEQWTQLVKIHLVQKGWTIEDMDFRLSMPSPESATNPELIDNQSSLIELSNNLIDALQGKILGDDSEVKLPNSIKRAIYKKILPYGSDIDNWIDTIEKEKAEFDKKKAEEESASAEGEESTGEESGADTGSDFTFESIYRKRNPKKKIGDFLKEEVYREKQKRLKNSVVRGRHEYSSLNRGSYTIDPARLFQEVKKAESIRMMG